MPWMTLYGFHDLSAIKSFVIAFIASVLLVGVSVILWR
jgi:hypothetical protein